MSINKGINHLDARYNVYSQEGGFTRADQQRAQSLALISIAHSLIHLCEQQD